MEEERKLKVWVLTNEYHPQIMGGLGIAATQLTGALSKAGMKVTVLCAGKSKRLTISNPNKNLRILRYPKNSQYFNRAQQSFKAAPVLTVAYKMGNEKPELVHVHSTEFTNTARKAGNQFTIPIVYTCHSIASQGPSSPRVKNQTVLIRTANRIVVPSIWQAYATKKRYPDIDSGKIAIIPHGVIPASKKSNGAPTQLLYVGRLIPSKGVESLLKAVSLLSRDHHQVHLTIVGSGKKSYEKKLKLLAEKSGIADRIRWVKRKPHPSVLKMFSSYGAIVVPSKKESFCLTALEAMANGVPLISTLSGGLKEFVNARNAQVIRAVNSKSIARAIRAFWRNPSQSKMRVVNARSTAAKYQWPVIAGLYRSLFTSLEKETVS